MPRASTLPIRWAERITALREGLNYEREFSAVGQEFSVADIDGNLIVGGASVSIVTARCR